MTIVTGLIDSGKTSWCRKLAARNPDFGGVLLAKVYQYGQRIGYDAILLPISERIPFARLVGHETTDWTESERVGRFSISGDAVQAANVWLAEAADRPTDIIIDEIGPLELQGGGLSAGLNAALASSLARRIYIVIRSECVKAVCRHFGIAEFNLVDISASSGKTAGPGLT